MLKSIVAAVILTTSSASALLCATPATAGEVRLSQPMQAGVLNESNVDMVVYFTEAGDAVELVATYVERDEPSSPARFRLRLSAGDDLVFALPGQGGTLYRFAHDGTAVTVETTPVEHAMAEAR